MPRHLKCPERSFAAVVRFYRKVGDEPMARLLELELDRWRAFRREPTDLYVDRDQLDTWYAERRHQGEG